ncbi:MAG: hypothetical protein ACRCS3_13440, partial [Paracoccaceae bacterium]
ADIVGPKLSVRNGPNLNHYNAICGPGFKRRDAEEEAHDREEILSLLQQITATPLTTALSPF